MTMHHKLCDQSPEEALEAMVDAIGLARVLDTLSMVCFAKAEHLAVNWQDTANAKVWTKAGHAIDALTARADIKAVSL